MNKTLNQQIDAASWQAAMRSAVVVPTYGFGMGDVCPLQARSPFGTAIKQRHADASVKATVKGFQPWSPPVP